MLSRYPSSDRIARGVALALLVMAAISSLRGSLQASSSPPTAQEPSPERQTTAPRSPARGAAVLEFDLPADYWTREADGGYKITGFRLGYFEGRRQTVVRIVEIAREKVTVSGGTGRINLDPSAIAQAPDVVIRLQTLVRGQASPWSESLSVGSQPNAGVASRPNAGRHNVGASARVPRLRHVTIGDIERSARLRSAWEKCLPPGAKPEEILAAFRRVEDLAMAVVLCRDYGIDLSALSRIVKGPPRRSPADAARELRPDVKQAAVRRARTTGRQLIDRPVP